MPCKSTKRDEEDDDYNPEDDFLADDVSQLSMNNKYSYDTVTTTFVSKTDKCQTDLCTWCYKNNQCHEKYS
eukprot:925931-Ditylum_brightwellii.AAC.1